MSGQGEGFDLFDEIRAVSAEALRLARDGGSVDERAAFHERKARALAAIEAAAAQPTSEPTRCQDWPVCGHDERAGCDEHAAIQRTIERTKGALRDRGAL